MLVSSNCSSCPRELPKDKLVNKSKFYWIQLMFDGAASNIIGVLLAYVHDFISLPHILVIQQQIIVLMFKSFL